MNDGYVHINVGNGTEVFQVLSWYNGLPDYVRLSNTDGSTTFIRRSAVVYMTISPNLPHDNA